VKNLINWLNMWRRFLYVVAKIELYYIPLYNNRWECCSKVCQGEGPKLVVTNIHAALNYCVTDCRKFLKY
jgi:hypothetical protein